MTPRRPRGEAGFTLIELLVGMVIGIATLLIAFQVLDRSIASQATVTKRTDASQRARQAMDLMTRQLRSQVCPGATGSSMLAASSTAVSFVADLGDGSELPERHVLTYDPSAQRITEQDYAGRGTATAVTFAATPMRTATLLDGVTPDGTTPIFRFFAYTSATPPTPTLPLPAPLTSTDLARAALILISFRVGPAPGTRDAATATTTQDQVVLRSASPYSSTPTPTCA